MHIAVKINTTRCFHMNFVIILSDLIEKGAMTVDRHQNNL